MSYKNRILNEHGCFYSLKKKFLSLRERYIRLRALHLSVIPKPSTVLKT